MDHVCGFCLADLASGRNPPTRKLLTTRRAPTPKEVCVRAATRRAFTLDRYGHLFEGHDAELRDRLDAMHAAGLERAGGGAVVELPAAPRGPSAAHGEVSNIQAPSW
jgi:hypothetical protein